MQNVVCALVRANLRNALVRNVYTLASIFLFAAWNAAYFERTLQLQYLIRPEGNELFRIYSPTP